MTRRRQGRRDDPSGHHAGAVRLRGPLRPALATIAAIIALLAAATPAEAHLLAGATAGQGGGLAAGFAHPLGGLDHVLAMVAVGTWATQIGGRARLLVPAAFAAMMALGAAGAMAVASVGPALPPGVVEPAIALSVPLLGGAILVALRPGLAASMALVGGFALFHGHAHGTEVPAAASPLAYAAGFLAGTLLLHGAGAALGGLLQRRAGARGLRLGGAALATVGTLLIAGV